MSFDKNREKGIAKKRRHARVRARISGTAERPRMHVFRSLLHIRVQLIDDVAGKTLLAASDTELKAKKDVKVERAKQLGQLIAQKAKAAGITNVVFDRAGNQYHGRVKALADGAREGGLIF
ncbi:MAG: 50S ribosomal protein L18 [Candidatus Buchananbacteria bacterium RIFCSPHIGHO2_01_FULL_47_11b]|uniref:Large ribosomal subunit protein uL18 n=1 Tax=Candidatus Buchananbacteria bacterium RIFCSPHIGHO2_01_FULL_47_11b TaxID=1797537 RepID=A0A1G1Y2R0_9BACT|nr:MAG: 50S ribosomal protein L18 [Candidatus Buchananbacteria bacterium RIFCSPHIGHO2_01_FULL_47_11b]